MDREETAAQAVGEKKRPDEVVLNFHNSLLLHSDIELLNGPHWLNDNLMAFHFEYLEKVKFKDYPKMLFVGPQVTQLIKMSQWRDIGVFLEPLNFNERDYIFFALNDCTYAEIPGGTHWSLLVLSKPEKIMCHLDSCPGSNNSHALKLSTNLSKHMQCEMDFTELTTTRQRNSYDCGIHVLSNVEHLASFITRENKIIGAGCVRRPVIQTKRLEFKQLILSMGQLSK